MFYKTFTQEDYRHMPGVSNWKLILTQDRNKFWFLPLGLSTERIGSYALTIFCVGVCVCVRVVCACVRA